MSMTLKDLERINSLVNDGVTFTSDADQWDVDERWEDALETGKEDCDGYAIAKIRLLFAEGWPREQLKLGLCYVETSERHAVAVATCNNEDFVLDNRYPHVMEWKLLPYRWEKFYLFGERIWRASGR